MSARTLFASGAVAALLGVVATPLPTLAHHGVTGHFDLDHGDVPISSTVTFFGSLDRRDPMTWYTKIVIFEDGRVLTRYGEVAEDGSFANPELDENAAQDRAGRDPTSTSETPNLPSN